jgi:protein TonB
MGMRSWSVAILLAVSVHVLALFAILVEAKNTEGDALDAGEMGIEVGAGTLGSFANIQERISMLSEASSEKIDTQEPEQVKKIPVKESNEKVIIKPVVEAVIVKENSFKPAKEVEKIIISEALTSPSENEREEVKSETKSSAAYVQAAIKSTGRSDQEKSGGAKGSVRNYINQMNRWLAQHQRYPLDAKKEKQEGTVRVAFTIDRKGNVLRRSIERSSGYPLLDDAALKVLDDASPLPEVPDDFAPGRAELSLVKPIDFTLITNTSFKD